MNKVRACLAMAGVWGCNTSEPAREQPRVQWPAASASNQAARLSLSTNGTRSAAEIDALIARSPVPVLAPSDRQLQKPTLSVGREYFAIAGREDGVTVHTQGTRGAITHADIAPMTGTRELRGTKGFVTVNEGIRTATWIENAAAYSVDVECSQSSDARCQDDTYLLGFVNHLVFVGGAGP